MNDHHNYIKKKKKKKKKRRVRRENDLVYPHRKRCSRSRQVPIEFTIGWWGWLGVGVGREEFGFHWAMMLHSFAAVNAWKWYTMLRSIVSPAQTEAWKWKLFIQIEFKKKKPSWPNNFTFNCQQRRPRICRMATSSWILAIIIHRPNPTVNK